jgi:hypothetical protein
MLRRCSRLQRSHVQTSRPFSVPRVQAITASAGSAATVPQVVHTGGCSASLADTSYFAVAWAVLEVPVSGVVAALALAWALAACLNSRTFCSDSGSTTSATHR